MKRRLKFFAVIFLFFVPFFSCAESYASSSNQKKSEANMQNVKTQIWKLDSHGEIFTYISPKVDLNNKSEKVPLVLAMNCTTGNPQAEVLTNGWLDLCAEEKLIVVAPTYNDYATYSEVPYIKKVIDEAIKKYPVDKSRVYATGFSNGGALSVALASECPQKITAISAAGWMVGARNTTHGFLVPFQVLQGTCEYTEKNSRGDFEIMDDEKIALSDLFKMNKMNVSSPDYHKNQFWGYEADKTQKIFPEYTDYDPYGNNAVKKSNIAWTVSDFYKTGYKNPFAQLILIDGAAHIPHSYHARIAWEFFKHFSRNESGEIIEN